jgi:hypothetical protein
MAIDGPRGEFLRWLALEGEPPKGAPRFARAFG